MCKDSLYMCVCIKVKKEEEGIYKVFINNEKPTVNN